MAVMAPWVFILLLIAKSHFCFSSDVYVVYMGSQSTTSFAQTLVQNEQMLIAVNGGSTERAIESHVYSYTSGFQGFAAKLTAEQALEMAEMPGVVSVFPSRKRILHTTESWNFMGLNLAEGKEVVGNSTTNQENVIIGLIDTGIWPESPSFNDEGMSPVPSRWKGECMPGASFPSTTCNKKIIGARYYIAGFQAQEPANETSGQTKSARDSIGHGTHTASTAAGRYVKNVSYNGLAEGEARGGAPLARIAVYKACWNSGCYDADILAAFDDAIKDGVDIISASLGSSSPQPAYFEDTVAIGAFHATSQGILVVASAGNEGNVRSVSNIAPWMLTVAAGSTDREFAASVLMGNQENITGNSLNTLPMNGSAPIILASDAAGGLFPEKASSCLESSLDKTKAEGKILVCHSGDPSDGGWNLEVKRVGGAGMILIDETRQDLALPFTIPSISVKKAVGDKIISYINSTRSPTALILPAKAILGSQPSPRVASFSSRGPNSLTPEILKPDITAPGLNILAAWSPSLNKINYNVISGTSMSCPHITGLAALIKSVNPSWSPAQIKSAVMTTATTLDRKGNPMIAEPEGKDANSFDYGAGYADSLKMLHPGLVYDAETADYKAFLCSIGYTDKQLRQITNDNSVCVKPIPPTTNLNYPSITVPALKDSYSVIRTVTNVGNDKSKYQAVISQPAGVSVTVAPDTLDFSKNGEKMKFTVTFKVSAPFTGYVFGSLTWRGNDINVTSPLVVKLAS